MVLLPDTYVGWARYAKAAARAAVAENRFDAVYSTSPPETSHLIAHDIHSRTGLPWVADFRDPWMNLYLLRPPTPLHARLHARLEKKVCERAYSVVATRWHEKVLRDKYPGGGGVRRISNGYDAAEAATVDAVRPSGDRLRITHAGMLTQNRTAVPFLHGVRKFLDDRPDAGRSLEIIFAGAREDRNEEAAHRLGLLGTVEFRDSIPHDETLQLERGSHILLLIKHVNPDYAGIVPGKLYEYIGLRRPILALVPEGEAAQLVTSLNRGIVAPQQDASAIAGILGRLYNAYRDGTLDSLFDLSPREQFSRENLAGELAGLLDEISQKHRDNPSGV
jgi:glycosyltransferase involved in cell wall biosynthesis